MPLYIGKKLDYLMRLTGTSNALLGRILNFDSSHISRIRSDKRGVPHKQPFIDPASEYFAKILTDTQKQEQAAKIICPGQKWPDSQEKAAGLLSSWFCTSESSGSFSDPMFPMLFLTPEQTRAAENLTQAADAGRRGTSFFYGNEGKREAVILFLSRLCEMSEPPILLLYSDEDMTWFTEDSAFVAKWAALLVQYLSKGGKIKIIHNVGRNLHEMLNALQKWMPLYMYGKIEAFYYPKLRDLVLRRTLFIAKYHSALVSNSIENNTDEMVNLLIEHIDVSKALAREFDNMLALCTPLMQIYRSDRILQLFTEISHFEETSAPLIRLGTVPSLYTMPAQTAADMETRNQDKPFAYDCQGLVRRVQSAGEHFRASLLAGHIVTDILSLPPIDQVRGGHIRVPICDFLGLPDLSYTASEFAAHLQSIVHLLKTQENYHVILTDRTAENVLILCKENIGVFVFPAQPKGIVFGINERELSISLWEYLNRIPVFHDRTQTIDVLEKYVRELLSFH